MSEPDSSDEELVERLFSTLIAFSLVSPKIILNKLQGLVRNIQWSTEDVTELFKALLERFDSTTQDRSHLFSWMLNMLQCIEINYITQGWKSQTGKTLIQLVRDKSVTDEHLKKKLADAPEKSLDEILEEIRQQKLSHIDDKLLKDVRDIVSAVDEDLTPPSDGSKRNDLKKVLLNLCRAVEKSQKFKPRLTQMVSWCIMALSKPGQLIQVGTGEGKSCIIAMFAAFGALKGEEVDIFTSSPVLAERDFKVWEGFYDELKIHVNCNTNKQVEHLKKCYECEVVYGTAEAFAGHWLCKRFERIDTFELRKFQCAIVDEVDSLMLDKGNHFVYIASDMPALQHLNPLLAFIWRTSKKYSDGSKVRAVEEDIKHALHFTPCELNEDRIACYVPGFLADLVNSKLKVWIENAFKAQTMTEDREYTLEKHGIVPVYYSSTGVVENFRVMPDGLQQFLEMKHKYKLSDMTAITNYMSNVGLFMKYKDQIFGISGTLGQQAETDTLERIYDVKTCQIPAFKRRKLFEVEGVITVKEVRDDLVAKELSSFSECEIPNIKKKESLFKQYLDTLDEEYQISDNKPAASDVSALNEFWGIWLLTNFNENESTSNLENKLREDLETARQKLRRRESPSSNLHHYTAFVNELRKRGQLADSIMMYTKAIQEDHCWAAIAYYNRAFASLSQQERQQDPNCIDQALEDLQNALKSVELHCEQIMFTHIYSKDIMDLCSDSVDRFDSHVNQIPGVAVFQRTAQSPLISAERRTDADGSPSLILYCSYVGMTGVVK
ncbi:hypothetical protein JOQ06_020301 [Pogonophryne albipinna]|uniref:Uncharacterized protein n=1 Tax=Pogonophryne albipinna TaxID=1090488 RepID=A0AAD6BTE9_9TELE|nr:hypothetical protein JOQ06_020301 [Pogonophryne albipinna]